MAVLPSWHWDPIWLGPVQALCVLPQSLWVLMCSFCLLSLPFCIAPFAVTGLNMIGSPLTLRVQSHPLTYSCSYCDKWQVLEARHNHSGRKKDKKWGRERGRDWEGLGRKDRCVSACLRLAIACSKKSLNKHWLQNVPELTTGHCFLIKGEAVYSKSRLPTWIWGTLYPLPFALCPKLSHLPWSSLAQGHLR